MSSQQILTTVMTNIVVEKRTDRTEPLSTFFFYHNVDVKIYFRVIHKALRDTLTRAALSLLF